MFRQISTYPNYEISKVGVVRNIKNKYPLRVSERYGLKCVWLSEKGKVIVVKLRDLIGVAFPETLNYSHNIKTLAMSKAMDLVDKESEFAQRRNATRLEREAKEASLKRKGG